MTVDEKNRIVLTKEVRKKAGISSGDRLLAIPFRGGVILIALRGKRFAGYLKDFVYKEEEHEATKYLLGKGCRS